VTVLVTGAGGFLGRHTVEALLRRGHDVRVLLRPAASLAALPWADRVEVVRADLRARDVPAELAAGVDRVVHLAASVTGDEDEMFAAGVVGTERLLAALGGAPLERFVLASSITVYDWSAANGVLTEDTPLEPDPYTRGGYTVAKLWQERLLRRAADERKFELVVLRPGFVWGRDQPYVAGAALSAGPLHLSFGGGARVPLTYVENCADCFAHALAHPAAAGETFNVVDNSGVPGADYFERYARAKGVRGTRIRAPYRAVQRVVQLVDGAARAILGPNARLPSAFHPARFEARFKPLEFSTEKLRTTLEWTPPVAYEEALARTFDS
jgi:UDP-glucose 4-epimerase